MLKPILITICLWIQFGLGHLDSDEDETEWPITFNSQNLKTLNTSSNLPRRLIHHSFAYSCVVETHPVFVKAWLFCRCAIDSQNDWLSYSMCLRAMGNSFMGKILPFLDHIHNYKNTSIVTLTKGGWSITSIVIPRSIHNFFKNYYIFIRKGVNPHSTQNKFNFLINFKIKLMLLMTKVNIGMMGIIQTVQGMKTMKTKSFPR